MKKNYFLFVVCLGMFLGLFTFKIPNDSNFLTTNNESSLNQKIQPKADPLIKHYYKRDSFTTTDEYITEHTFFFQIEVIDITDESFNPENVSVKNGDEVLHVLPINASKSSKENIYTYEVVDLWSGTTYDELELTIYKDKVFMPLNTEVQTHQSVVPQNTTLYIVTTALAILLLFAFIIFITFYESKTVKSSKNTSKNKD